MEENNYYQTNADAYIAKNFVSNVFMWMFAALAITAVTAWLCADISFLNLMFTETGISFFGWVVMLAPLVLVFIMAGRIDRLSTSQMIMLYLVYSVLTGMSLGSIFLIYTEASIMKTFAVAGGMFAVMAVVGYTTKTDLTKFGRLLIMGLIGIIIATLVNFFTGSARLDYIISIVGVLIFTGLTAYDMQKLKAIGGTSLATGESASKLAIWGALSLYLDFLNLFLYLLRFFGRRN